jgi:hypothetical protein
MGDIVFKSIFDPHFKYRNAVSTDVRKTFERVRQEQQRLDERRKNGTFTVVAGRIARGQRFAERSNQSASGS